VKIRTNSAPAIKADPSAPVCTAPTPITAAPIAMYPGKRAAMYARHEGN
jgi:hypothetical protein